MLLYALFLFFVFCVCSSVVRCQCVWSLLWLCVPHATLLFDALERGVHAVGLLPRVLYPLKSRLPRSPERALVAGVGAGDGLHGRVLLAHHLQVSEACVCVRTW